LGEILGVSKSEASKFITSFLGKFPGVANFVQETIDFAKKNCYVKTLVNRRRLLPDMNSTDVSKAKTSERQVIFLIFVFF
jgi:DNA polymerase-1